ncbi:histidinol-phosphate transaminase [Entomophthora muscae]|uniref:Histidinol-phosphate transaminase n=1 Tax=Entomophthora muscae TaxID=34485 RepID=A0ACC2U9U4_9FUNG|nr:histidinol-phosphate transaminase [Entomophthora muscae]
MSGFQLDRIVRKNILALKPYRCARDDFTEGILLDANENAFGTPFEAEKGSLKASLNRYPDPHQSLIKERLLKINTAIKSTGNIFLGVGSDEVIDLILRIFCRPGVDKILITPPTYGMYKVSAQINDVGIEESFLTPEEFQLNSKEIKEKNQFIR